MRTGRELLARWWRPTVLLGLLAGLGAAACPKTDATGPTITGLVITPSGVSLHPGQQATFFTYARKSNGDSVAATVTYTATGGSITTGGVYTAGGTTGSFHAVAQLASGTLTDTASITIDSVPPAPVATVTVTPAHPSVTAGTTVGLTATTKDSNGAVLAGRVVTWSSGTTGVGTVNGSGVVTGVAAGTTVITATSEGKQGKDTVTVTAATATLVRITLSPDSVGLLTGHTQQFGVLGTFSDSSTATVPVTYSATGGTINSSGLYTAGGTPGSYRVIAVATGGLADTSKVTVTAPTLVRVLLTPDSVQLDTGASQQFTANGKFSDSSTSSITATYAQTGGSISAGGLYTAGATPGTFRVIATASGHADTSKVVIVAPTLVRVMLTPDSAQVDTGHTQQFTATGKFSDSSTAAITATFSATGGTINGSGLYTAGTTAGTFKVIATKSALADTSKLVVVAPSGSSAAECATPGAGWIFCDDFEQDRSSSYFETDGIGTVFNRTAGVGFNGSYGMDGHFTAGASSAGDLHLAFGKTPQSYMKPVDAGTANYREIYWRMYVKAQAGWIGGAHDKLTRALIFGSSTSFAEAMAAHVWGGDVPSDSNNLILDPASGVDSAGNLVTTTYNDPKLVYLGKVETTTPLFDAAHVGQWYCVEAHVKLNDSGSSNGVFELWINGNLEAQKTGMNWVSSYSAYGINAIYFENYWNNGATVAEDRFFDRIVVSTQPIGC